MLNIAICEDNRQQMDIILTLLDTYSKVRPGIQMNPRSFASGDELLETLDSGQTFNLFLLDILMPGINGIELAGELRLREADIPLVFFTSSPDYALDAFNVSALQYLLKPVKADDLFPVLDKSVSLLKTKEKEEKFFVAVTQENTVKIPYSSLIFVETIQRTMRFYLTDGRKLESKSMRISFETAIAPLLGDTRFLHARKSHVLNMEHVKALGTDSFVMMDGTKIYLPIYRYVEAKNKYFSYISGSGSFAGNIT